MSDREEVGSYGEFIEKESDVSMADVPTCEGSSKQNAVEKKRHSRLGIASFVSSLTLLLVFCAGIVWAVGEIKSNGGESAAILLPLLCLVLSALYLLPLAFGIAGILEKGTRKIFAVLGVCLTIIMITIFLISLAMG